MNDSERALFARALRVFGHDRQIVKAVEELSELQVELAKALLSNGAYRNNLYTELVDAQIMLDQMKMLFFGDSTDKVDPEDTDKYSGRRMAQLERLSLTVEAAHSPRRILEA